MSRSSDRPVLLGVFERNARQNVILDMDTCDRLGLGMNNELVLYLTPEGQVVGKVVRTRYLELSKETARALYGSQADYMGPVPDHTWLSEWTPGEHERTMPRGFLAPEDTRW